MESNVRRVSGFASKISVSATFIPKLSTSRKATNVCAWAHSHTSLSCCDTKHQPSDARFRSHHPSCALTWKCWQLMMWPTLERKCSMALFPSKSFAAFSLAIFKASLIALIHSLRSAWKVRRACANSLYEVIAKQKRKKRSAILLLSQTVTRVSARINTWLTETKAVLRLNLER